MILTRYTNKTMRSKTILRGEKLPYGCMITYSPELGQTEIVIQSPQKQKYSYHLELDLEESQHLMKTLNREMADNHFVIVPMTKGDFELPVHVSHSKDEAVQWCKEQIKGDPQTMDFYELLSSFRDKTYVFDGDLHNPENEDHILDSLTGYVIYSVDKETTLSEFIEISYE